MTNKYEQGKIYKVCDVSYTMAYYGSTIVPLCKRMANHRYNYRQYKSNGEGDNLSVFRIFDEFGIDNCKIELVELFPCASKMELERKEGEYIKNNECVNKTVAGRTLKEWRQDNPDYMKNWDDTHKEQRRGYSKTIGRHTPSKLKRGILRTVRSITKPIKNKSEHGKQNNFYVKCVEGDTSEMSEQHIFAQCCIKTHLRHQPQSLKKKPSQSMALVMMMTNFYLDTTVKIKISSGQEGSRVLVVAYYCSMLFYRTVGHSRE